MEPIFKGVDASNNFDRKIASREIYIDNLQQYIFTIDENSLNYLGVWNFNTGLVSFIDNMNSFDEDFNTKYRNLDFTEAILNLPK